MNLYINARCHAEQSRSIQENLLNQKIKLSFLLILITLNAYSQITLTCDTTKSSNSNNLGIYGGLATDLTFNNNGRLFAGCAVSNSIFISDDTAKTWYPAFEEDSLEYECGTRGWGGGGLKILSNTKGWVGARTAEAASTFTSSQISFQNGDTGTWHTAVDGFLLEELGYQNLAVTATAMSDYYFYVAVSNYIVKTDTSPTNASDVLNIHTSISGLSTNYFVRSLAVANSVSGYPYYMVIDTAPNFTTKSKLYKFNGSSFSIITLPPDFKAIDKVFTHPGQSKGDTVFVSGINTSGKIKICRSYDGGTIWTNIAPSTIDTKNYLTDVDYSPSWKSKMPLSNGLLLINGLSQISKDMGATWISTDTLKTYFSDVYYSYALAVHPSDTGIYAGSHSSGVYVSTSGCKGPFTEQTDIGLEAIQISKIDHDKNESVFYLATVAGIAYTTKYLDKNIASVDKWKAPYGQFPISNTDISGGLTSLAIDQADSSHVIAGCKYGFFTSHTGPNGFSLTLPSGFDTAKTMVTDIAFVTSNIIIAVTGVTAAGYVGLGEIWRSVDGGDTWSIISPSGFGTGLAVAIGFGTNDTVIYVGSGFQYTETGYLWISIDLGNTWVKINGPNDSNYPSIQGLAVNDIAVDPRGKDTLYIAAGYDTLRAFVKSTDGGLTYQDIPISTTQTFNSLEIDPSNPDSIVYIANVKKSFLYNPALDTATLIYSGLPGEIIYDIAIGSILVGTTTGFYTFELEPIDDLILQEHEISKNRNNTILLYPVPAKDQLFIKLNNQNSKARNTKIYLYNAIGSLIAEKNISQNNQIEVSNLKPGTYIIKLIADDQEYAPEKIVVGY